jgi:hypothetical protein
MAKNPKKTKVTEILHKFYDENSNLTEEFEGIFNYSGDITDLEKANALFSEILNKHKNKFDRIMISVERGYDGDYLFPSIVGVRQETDKEHKNRTRREKQKEKQSQIKEKQRKAGMLKRKKELSKLLLGE